MKCTKNLFYILLMREREIEKEREREKGNFILRKKLVIVIVRNGVE